jgi:hypothetical protein
MTTLQLKKSNTEELLKTIQSQNEWIIQLLEENNKLLKQKNTGKTGPNRHELVEKILTEFAPGNNYNTMIKLIKFIGKWSKDDIAKIRQKLVDMGISKRHMNTFDRMLAKS